MKLAMIGLGRMGMNMAKRLLQGGHQVVAYNRSPEKTEQLVKDGAMGAYSLVEVAEKLSSPRIVWMMLPAGQAVDDHIHELKDLLAPGDIVIDGGNTYYKDDILRANLLDEKGISFMDVGVSGGIWGLKIGYCMMIGGEKETFKQLEPIFKTLAPQEGYLYCGGTGAGHFVKMVHNGIEYGMMQSIAEGFAIMEASGYDIDLQAAADVYDHGSVIEAQLMTWLRNAFEEHGQDLAGISGTVRHTGEGEWTTAVASEFGVDARAIEGAFRFRVESEGNPSYTGRILSALRNQFGGHAAT